MKTLILYGSTTGNTEMVAEDLQDMLSDLDPKLMDVADAEVEDLEEHELLIVGSSTWDDGLLQQDFRDYAEKLETQKPDLSSKKVAIFALGDSNYPDFCEAANILEELLVGNLGAQQIGSTLKIDGFPDEEENEEKVEAWSKEIKELVS